MVGLRRMLSGWFEEDVGVIGLRRMLGGWFDEDVGWLV